MLIFALDNDKQLKTYDNETFLHGNSKSKQSVLKRIKTTIMRIRLNENNDFAQRVKKLEEFASELQISVFNYNAIFLRDDNTGREYSYRDNESSECLSNFPAHFERKITYDNED